MCAFEFGVFLTFFLFLNLVMEKMRYEWNKSIVQKQNSVGSFPDKRK